MATSKRKGPATACNSHEAQQRKLQGEYSTCLVREITGTVITALLFSLIVWTAIDGMADSAKSGFIKLPTMCSPSQKDIASDSRQCLKILKMRSGRCDKSLISYGKTLQKRHF